MNRNMAFAKDVNSRISSFGEMVNPQKKVLLVLLVAIQTNNVLDVAVVNAVQTGLKTGKKLFKNFVKE